MMAVTRNSRFVTTRWSLVLSASGLRSVSSREALSWLCEAYWAPLYSFARHRGHSQADAEDLVQAFFARLLDSDGLRGVEPGRGRFRSYLLGAFKHFLYNADASSRALKRGGGEVQMSLDVSRAEETYVDLASPAESPERLYERRWAATVVDRSLARLREEHEAAGKGEVFRELKHQLVGEAERGIYGRLASELGQSPESLRVAAHRMRARLRDILLEEVAATVETPGEMEAELAYLREVLRG